MRVGGRGWKANERVGRLLDLLWGEVMIGHLVVVVVVVALKREHKERFLWTLNYIWRRWKLRSCGLIGPGEVKVKVVCRPFCGMYTPAYCNFSRPKFLRSKVLTARLITSVLLPRHRSGISFASWNSNSSPHHLLRPGRPCRPCQFR